MDRSTRTHSERLQARTSCASPTLIAVLLLLTVVPGAAAYAVVENEIALRTTLREAPRRDEAREAVRASATLAEAIMRTVRANAPAALLPTNSAIAGFETRVVEASRIGEASAHVAPAGGVRAALLNLPPPSRL